MRKDTVRSFLENKTIVIIGATGGIGEVFAQQCNLYSEKVILVARSHSKLNELSSRLSIKNTYVLDITDNKRIPEIIDVIEKTVGEIDLCVNLAGYDVFNSISNISIEEIMASNRINFEGPIILSQALIEKFIKREKGVIANVSAFSNGQIPFPFYNIDSASRAGIATFYRTMRREISSLYPEIRFVLFSPPITNTETERSRISSKVWEKLNMKFHSPEVVVDNILNQIALGKNEIIPIDERLLLLIEKISKKVSDIAFFNSFNKVVNQVFKKK